jgi:hypothetical protein
MSNRERAVAESKEDAHARRVKFAKDIIEEAANRKSKLGAFGGFSVNIIFREGLVHEVVVNDETSYR